jgi:hypothetical protein
MVGLALAGGVPARNVAWASQPVRDTQKLKKTPADDVDLRE